MECCDKCQVFYSRECRVETEAKETEASVTIALFGHSHGIKMNEGFKF